ncbi:hypothetical protein RHGRI_031412 [Rhododendron griersonianum]|uniref:Uncharacterized protein n=1 Tax=Rhododendron griersonianum TaxID=479676 RepID=A0AAV6IAY6_9ERIC|nr:hypothetical protein RHGRI_031412 [Rhododendron griersonianum]
MPKKSSSKPQKPQDPVAVPEKNPSPAPKKSSKEIDEIFAAKKRKKTEQNQDNPVKAEGSKLDKVNKKKKKREAPKESGTADPPSRPRKRTGDGFTVYSQEELGIGKADAGGEGPGYEPACLNANLKQMGSAMMVENPISSACHGFEILMPDTLIA